MWRPPFALGSIAAIALTLACRGGSGGGIPSTAAPTAATSPPLETLTAPATVTNDGLQIIEIKAGDGDEAQAGDIVYINFNEWLTDGTWIDTNGANGTPVPDRLLLRQGQVLQGLLEGIPGMKVDGKRRLVIPPDLGFGSQGSGNTIPPGATLVYDIELVRVSHS